MSDMDYDELCQWLRNNSSGVYRPSAEAADVIDQLRARVAELESERADLRAARDAAWDRIGELEAEVKVDDDLLNDRNRLLNEIPACPAHGSRCIPHAIAWINDAKDLMNSEGDDG